MSETKESLDRRYEAVMRAIRVLGGELDDDYVRKAVVTDEIESGEWFAWLGHEEDDLAGDGATEQAALDDLGKALMERIEKASALLAEAAGPGPLRRPEDG
jgi:hypothetical protein